MPRLQNPRSQTLTTRPWWRWSPSAASPAILAALISLGASVAASAVEQGAASAQEASGSGCSSECRGLGIEKVKAGDEHCGLVPRERKDAALDAACTLAESHREELQARAEEQARSECGSPAGRQGCRCDAELRPWQNVYTHVFSQRCWTECGWAVLLECQRASEAEEP